MAKAKTIVVKLGSPEEAAFLEVGSEIINVNRAAGEFTLLLREGDAAWRSPRANEVEIAD